MNNDKTVDILKDIVTLHTKIVDVLNAEMNIRAQLIAFEINSKNTMNNGQYPRLSQDSN
jgi:hypothetical protein